MARNFCCPKITVRVALCFHMCCSVNNIYHTCINFCSCGGWEKGGVRLGGGIVIINENCKWEE